MPAAKYVVALEQFGTERDGQAVVVPHGARYRQSDPIVGANPARSALEPRKRATKRTGKSTTQE